MSADPRPPARTATTAVTPDRPAGIRSVVGTAGHVDHGKTTLVRALTGIDCDRLPEEKRRGMTIELGFAAWRLPSGDVVGIVDVPGHHRFVRTMLAGAHGIDCVLLVVAADEGVMPQTREHVAICDLLGCRRAVVALTKCDLVDRDILEVATAEVEEVLEGTTLAGAPIVPCSAVTGEGLEVLAATVADALRATAPRPDRGRPRLWIDRRFARPGFGTVVTGTLEGGHLEIGDEVVVLPGGRCGRIRSLEHHGVAVTRAEPGRRTAVNLAGVGHDEVERGDALAHPETIVPTDRLDVHLRVLPDSPGPVRHREAVAVFLGTAEVLGQVWLLEGQSVEPGHWAYAQLLLDRPVPAVLGDRFVLRRPSPAATLGGGTVLDVAPRRHRRGDRAVAVSLARRESGSAADVVAEELAKLRLGAETADLARRLGLPLAEVRAAIADLGDDVVALGGRVLAATRWGELRDRAISLLRAFHDAEPLRRGMPREEWRSRLRLPGGPLVTAVVRRLADEGVLVEQGADLALSDHDRAAAPPPEAEALLALLARRGLDAPTEGELRETGATRRLLHYLAETGLVVLLRDDLVLAADVVAAARERVERFLEEHGAATVAEIRDALGATRRVVVPLLEHFDATQVTVREGDRRRLRQRSRPTTSVPGGEPR